MNPSSLIRETSYRNLAFEKALALLAHPLSLAAIGLLMLNDHLLRWMWPSWWTGKVGDFAWLLFAPFMLAAGLAWVLPLKDPARERWSIGLAVGGVGVVFVMFKLIGGFVEMATRIFTYAFHTPVLITRDPSDLVALPSLLLAYFLWTRTATPTRFSLRGWIALPLAALLTLANAGLPDLGISCFSESNGTIYAGSSFTAYASNDGGITWKPEEMMPEVSCGPDFTSEQNWTEVPGPQQGTIYRFRSGDNIEVSTDSGSTWQLARELSTISEARQLYYLKSRQGYTQYEPGPLAAIADPQTGNMLFAMSHQGVLVHTASGKWVWSQVGNYRPLEPFPTLDAVSLVLGGTFFLAAALALLVFCSQALRWAGGTLRIVILSLAWAGGVVVIVLFPPAQATGYNSAISGLGTAAVLLLAAPLAIEQALRLLRRAPAALLQLVGFGLLAGLLFILPYILWLYSTLPSLWWATIFGLVISVVVAAAAIIAAQRHPKQLIIDRKQD